MMATDDTISLYDRLLGEVFPRNILNAPDIRYAFVLRVIPSFQAESQIIIVKRKDSSEEVKVQRSLSGNIDQKFQQLIEGKDQVDLIQLANQFRVQTLHVKAPASHLAQWRQAFLSAAYVQAANEKRMAGTASKTDQADLLLDGTAYDLWYVGEYDVRYEFHRAPRNPDEHPFTLWIKDILRTVEKLPASSNGHYARSR